MSYKDTLKAMLLKIEALPIERRATIARVLQQTVEVMEEEVLEKMVNAKEAYASEWLKADTVKQEQIHKIAIVGEGEYEKTKFGKKLVLPVEADGMRKKWTLNKATAQNLAEAWGDNTLKWVGKVVNLTFEQFEGKDVLVGVPVE